MFLVCFGFYVFSCCVLLLRDFVKLEVGFNYQINNAIIVSITALNILPIKILIFHHTQTNTNLVIRKKIVSRISISMSVLPMDSGARMWKLGTVLVILWKSSHQTFVLHYYSAHRFLAMVDSSLLNCFLLLLLTTLLVLLLFLCGCIIYI